MPLGSSAVLAMRFSRTAEEEEGEDEEGEEGPSSDAAAEGERCLLAPPRRTLPSIHFRRSTRCCAAARVDAFAAGPHPAHDADVGEWGVHIDERVVMPAS